MKVDSLKINTVKAIEGMNDQIADVKALLEQKLNLSEYSDGVRPVAVTMSTVLRFCLMVGLSD